MDELRAAGLDVEPQGDISQPFVSVGARILKVNEDTIQVFEYADARGNSGGSLSGSFSLASGNTRPEGIADPPPALLPSENDSASAIALADGYFAVAAWKAFRPIEIETAKIDWATRERPSSDVVTNDRFWPAPSADPRTDPATFECLERSRLQSYAVDQALVDPAEHDFLEDDLVTDLALAVSKLQ